MDEQKNNEAMVINEQELKQKIGQMLIVGFRGVEAGEYLKNIIVDLNIGGVILFDWDVPSDSFPRNIENPKQVKKLTEDLQKFSTTTLFIAIDAEGGKINRLKQEYGFIAMPSHRELGQIGDFDKIKEYAEKLAEQLKELGFNMNFAPVVDLNINEENPIIGKLERSFSNNPKIAAEAAAAFITAHQEQGIISVIKHFPGHGSSNQDSHLGLVDVTETYEEQELLPYRLLEEQGLIKAVMTAHIINHNIDKQYPATLSPLFIENILRRQIGFNGAVISDDMQMEAINGNYGLEQAIIKAINAGCDIILLSNNSQAEYDQDLPYKAHAIIFNAVQNGLISMSRINQAFSRIISLKQTLD